VLISGFRGRHPTGDVSHKPNSKNCHYFLPGPRLPYQLHSITALGWHQFILLGEEQHECEWHPGCNKTRNEPASSRSLVECPSTYCSALKEVNKNCTFNYIINSISSTLTSLYVLTQVRCQNSLHRIDSLQDNHTHHTHTAIYKLPHAALQGMMDHATRQNSVTIIILTTEILHNPTSVNNWRKSYISFCSNEKGNCRHQTLPPVLPPSESFWVYALLASPLPGQLWANVTSSTKPKYITYCIVVRGGLSYGLQFLELWMCSFEDVNRHTDRLTAIQKKQSFVTNILSVIFNVS